jgi:hypothetical protein
MKKARPAIEYDGELITTASGPSTSTSLFRKENLMKRLVGSKWGEGRLRKKS